MLDERQYLIENIIKNTDARILEIGPLNYPVVKKDSFKNCFYCDIRSTEQVKALYSGNDYLETTNIKIDLDSIVNIDYVLEGTYQETFLNIEKFDFVVASHVMEHIEDIIGFLTDISSIMKPKGKLCILYPDKRYCFDHFREPASFRDAYDVYRRGHRETAKMVLDFFNTSIEENDPHRFWSAESISSLIPVNDTSKAIRNYEMVLQGEKMDDVHFWPFTDRGFLKFLYDGVRAHLFPFSCIDFHPTQEDTQQFLTVLEYRPEVIEDECSEVKNLITLIGTVPLDYHNSRHLELERKNIELNNENIQIIDKLSEAESSNAALTIKYEQLTTAYSGLEKQNIQLNSDVRMLTNRNATLGTNISNLTERESLLMSEVASLQTIENSTIWRMTKPVRVMLDLIKRPFKRK